MAGGITDEVDSALIDANSGESSGTSGSSGTPETSHSQSSYELSDYDKSINCCDDKVLLMKTIASGQLLSVMLCSTGTAVTALSSIYGVQTPCFFALLMYSLLAFTFGIYTITRKDFFKQMKPHWWKYLLVSICDVEANYFLTKSYSFTSLTSVQLCDSITIPTVMIVSFIFLRIRYKIIHYIGVMICISGAVCLIFTDSGDKRSQNGSNEVMGDILALCGAVLYGISQVGQEYLVKNYTIKEYLGMIGIYGLILSSIQVSIVERSLIHDIQWTWKIGLLIAAFAVCQYFYYSVMPTVMQLSSATVVNLSLLTSDLYTMTVGLFLFSYKFSYLYFVAFAGIVIGLIAYNIKPTPTAPPKTKKKKKNENIADNTDQQMTEIKNADTLLSLSSHREYGSTSPTHGIRITENTFRTSKIKDYVIKCTH